MLRIAKPRVQSRYLELRKNPRLKASSVVLTSATLLWRSFACGWSVTCKRQRTGLKSRQASRPIVRRPRSDLKKIRKRRRRGQQGKPRPLMPLTSRTSDCSKQESAGCATNKRCLSAPNRSPIRSLFPPDCVVTLACAAFNWQCALVLRPVSAKLNQLF